MRLRSWWSNARLLCPPTARNKLIVFSYLGDYHDQLPMRHLPVKREIAAFAIETTGKLALLADSVGNLQAEQPQSAAAPQTIDAEHFCSALSATLWLINQQLKDSDDADLAQHESRIVKLLDNLERLCRVRTPKTSLPMGCCKIPCHHYRITNKY